MFSFNRQEKPLPTPVLTVDNSPQQTPINKPLTDGILLGETSGNNCYWNPASLPNGHIVAIGASGSGKTQTLKAIAYSLRQTYPDTQLFIIDFHGDQQIEGETVYPLHMASQTGINPLTINLDPEGGGPNLQAIAVTATLKKSLRFGPNQEGLMLEILSKCYEDKGIIQSDLKTWSKTPPNFADLKEEISARIEDGCKESNKLLLKLAATFQYGVFSREQPEFTDKHIRIDLSKLPPEIGAIAAESLAWQLMNKHRLMGETGDKFQDFCFEKLKS